MEGHLRGIVGLLKVEEIVKEPEIVAGRVRDSVSDDLNKMGLEVVSFTIKKVIDENDYINNMGRPDIARVKREADIAQAEAERDTAIQRAMAMREAAVAQALADQERVIAQTASETKQAEATRDLEVKKARIRGRGPRAARPGREGLRHRLQPGPAEGHRRTGAHRAGPAPGADQGPGAGSAAPRARARSDDHQAGQAERSRIEKMAEAQRQKLATEAAARPRRPACKVTPKPRSCAPKARPKPMRCTCSAAAYQEYSQAAVLDKLISGHARGRARAVAVAG